MCPPLLQALVRRGLPFQVSPAPNLTPLDSADDVAAILKAKRQPCMRVKLFEAAACKALLLYEL